MPRPPINTANAADMARRGIPSRLMISARRKLEQIPDDAPVSARRLAELRVEVERLEKIAEEA